MERIHAENDNQRNKNRTIESQLFFLGLARLKILSVLPNLTQQIQIHRLRYYCWMSIFNVISLAFTQKNAWFATVFSLCHFGNIW